MLSTLDDGQQDDDHEEEEGDVEQDAVKLVGVSSRVLQLVSNASSSSHTDIHVEQIALWREKKERGHMLFGGSISSAAHEEMCRAICC